MVWLPIIVIHACSSLCTGMFVDRERWNQFNEMTISNQLRAMNMLTDCTIHVCKLFIAVLIVFVIVVDWIWCNV